MGGSNPSTVNQPFSSVGNTTQNQQMTGNLATAGTQTFTPNAWAGIAGQNLSVNARNLDYLYGQYPGQQVAGFDPTQESALQQVYGAGTGLGGLVGQGQNAVGQGMYGTYQAGQGLTGEDVAGFYNPMAGNITAQMQNIFGQQNAQATGNAAKTAGGVGASRIGVAQGNLANQQALSAGQTYAGLYQNALQAAQQQKQQQLAAGQALAGQGGNAIQTGMGGLNAAYQTGATRQAQQQAINNAIYQQQMGNFQTPFNVVAAQNAAMQGLGTLGGTTTQVGGQQGTQTGTMSADVSQSGQQSTQYPQPSLTSQIAGLGGLAVGAAGLLLNRGGRALKSGGRAYASGGAAQSILPYTPMTQLFSGQSQRPSTPGPQGPVNSDLSAITGDIQKYVNLKNLYKKAPFASQHPGVTNQATPDISSRVDTEQASPSKSSPYDEGEGEGYQEGGDVEDQTDNQDTQDQSEDQPDWGRMLGLENTVPMPAPRPATFDQRFGDLPPAQGKDVQPGEANFDERFGNLPSPNGALTGEGVQMPLPRPAAAGPGVAASGTALPAPTEAAGLAGVRGVRGGGVGGGGFMDRLSDPRRLALIQMGLGMAAASGQRDAHGLPLSPLAVIGQGGSQGLQAYQKGQALASQDSARRSLEENRIQRLVLDQQRQLETARWHNILERQNSGMFAPGAGGAPLTQDPKKLAETSPIVNSPDPKSGLDVVDASALKVESSEGNKEYLDSLPEDQRNLLKAMHEGRVAPPSASAMRSAKMQQLMASLYKAYPDTDTSIWKTRNETRAAFSKGQEGRSVTSLGTLMGHLNDLKDTSEKLSQSKVKVWNNLRNNIKDQLGEDQLADYNTARTAVADELARVFQGVGASTEQEKQRWLEALDNARSPEQFKAVIGRLVKLTDSRMRALEERYDGGMQYKADDPRSAQKNGFLNSSAKEKYDTLKEWSGGKTKAPLEEAPAAAPAQSAKPAPSDSDRAYAKAHPEVREMFINRFGVEP